MIVLHTIIVKNRFIRFSHGGIWFSNGGMWFSNGGMWFSNGGKWDGSKRIQVYEFGVRKSIEAYLSPKYLG